MNRSILCSLLLLLITGCAQRSSCPTETTAELVSAISTITASQGMTTTDYNQIVGILQASLPEKSLESSEVTTSRHWVFTIKDGLVGAYARVVTRRRDAAGTAVDSTERFYSDTAPEEWEWFWNVRRGLGNICGARVDYLKLR